MKKVLAAVCSALLIVVMAFSFAGCNVEGNTYVYDSYTASYTDENMSDIQKAIVDGLIAAAVSPFTLIKYEFEADGVVKVSGVSGKYTQEGNEVTINGIDKLTASGNKLKRIVKEDKFSLTITYKKA